MTKLALLAAVLAAGCKKTPTAESCGALTVTVDGKPLPAMPNGLARLTVQGSDKLYEVQVFNHDKSTCEQFVDRSGRQIPDGEVSVRAFAGGDGLMGKGVGIESHTQAGGDVDVVTKPKAVGDPVSICVGGVSFTPRIGDFKDKKVEMRGLFTGKYCGELKM
jgi:hypothetical protein